MKSVRLIVFAFFLAACSGSALALHHIILLATGGTNAGGVFGHSVQLHRGQLGVGQRSAGTQTTFDMLGKQVGITQTKNGD